MIEDYSKPVCSNLFTYCRSNPVRYRDDGGYETEECWDSDGSDDLHLPGTDDVGGGGACANSSNLSAGVQSGICNQYNYRANALNYYGTDGTGMDAHHVFPQSQEFAQQFSDAGINIHIPQNIEMIEHSIHMAHSYEYNSSWRQFFADNPNASCNVIHHAAGFFMEVFR